MSQEVMDYIATANESWKTEVSTKLREIIHHTIPDVQERLQYKKPHFMKNGKYAAVISISKKEVSFTIFNAVDVEWPEGKFEGPPERKTIKISADDNVNYEELALLLKKASDTI